MRETEKGVEERERKSEKLARTWYPLTTFYWYSFMKPKCY
jgi:hypothetical protein